MASSRRPRPVSSLSPASNSRRRVGERPHVVCRESRHDPVASVPAGCLPRAPARVPRGAPARATASSARARASATLAPVAISVAAQRARSGPVVGQRLVDAEEAVDQPQRSRAPHDMLAGDLQQTIVSVHVLVHAGAPRRAVDPRRRAADATVSCSSSTMLSPLDQYTAVGVWLGRRASISSTLGSRAAHHHLDVHQAVQAETLGETHGRGVEGGQRARRHGAVPGERAAGAGGRRPSGPGLAHRRHDALAVVGRRRTRGR